MQTLLPVTHVLFPYTCIDELGEEKKERARIDGQTGEESDAINRID